ncbi:PREDICTED: uncharacterized protein LOC105459839 isoform X2 [Wasmannia auropunctata]|nr:PREDICTED: uncharacterized protein LOC105459839 isoform X2 [Wasmannia auropunctata]
MEAMRSLQRDVDQPSTSTAEEIADYIRTHYRYDGDLYAQVRTALRQVCSQGFVKELLSNEYYLVGPISPTKWNGCSLNCTGRTVDDASRRRERIDDRRNGVCDCARLRRRDSRQVPGVPREETLRTFTIDRLAEEPIFHSTSISADEKDNADRRVREFNADVSDIRDYRRRRDVIGMEQRDDYAEPIPGPSREIVRALSPAPARNAKKARVDDRGVQRADEEDDETTTEEDVDCTCDEVVTQDEYSRVQPPDCPRVIIRNQRNGRRRRDDAVEDQEDEEKRMDEDGGEDEEERMEEEEDDDAEDSVYEELRVRVPRRRTAARERELKRWIRRCRQECERQMRRGR